MIINYKMSDTPETEELKCLSLIEVMAIPQERREIALGTLRAIKERDEAREEINNIRVNLGEDAEGFTTLLHAVCALQNERDSFYYELQNAKQSLEVALEDLNEYKKKEISPSQSD